MRPIYSLLMIPALVAAPSLPSPTPGLTEEGQRINYLVLAKGIVAKSAKVEGRLYTVRGLQNVLVLYNDKGHVIVICQCRGDEIMYVLSESKEDPFQGASESRTVTMDGHNYVVKIYHRMSPVVAVYNEKGKIIFAVADPAGVMVPDNGEATNPSSI